MSEKMMLLPRVVGLEHRPTVRPFTSEEVRFEIDMCIGCNRCMAACPVPISSLVTIADLNEATMTSTISSPIAEFTDQCVMCGLCVPVCPVGDHRDLLMLSLKERLGIPWDRPVDARPLLDHLPAGWTPDQVLLRVRQHPLFATTPPIPEQYLWHLLLASHVSGLAAGSIMMREGDFGHSLYCILDGACSLSALGPDEKPIPLAKIGGGEYLGEQGVLTGQARTTTATTIAPTLVLEIPEPALRTLMEAIPAVRELLTSRSHHHSVEALLKRMALFQGMATVDLHQLIGAAQVRYYERNERLFVEEEQAEPPCIHLLLDGFVKVARRSHRITTELLPTDERIIAYRQGGDYFVAGVDLVGDGRPVSVTTITRTSVCVLPYALLSPLFARYPEINQRFQTRFAQYREAALAAQTGVMPALGRLPSLPTHETEPQARAGLRSLVGDGVVEGTDILVIDLDRCVHCNECEEACARRHGQNRMNRKGMVVGNISVVTACRQCQDPVCMLCSRAGIARHPNGEVYITESCIGCGICAERCPYDNIQMVDLAQAHPEAPSAWDRFSHFWTKGAGKEYGRKRLPMAAVSTPPTLDVSQPPVDAYGAFLKQVAIKCDSCAGYGNQACVVACPTGAIIRTRPNTFFGSTEEILQRKG